LAALSSTFATLPPKANSRPLNPASTARVAMHPIHPILVPEMMWADFSAWLLFAGLVVGVLAALAGLIDFLSSRLIRGLSSAWLHMAGNAVVLILALFNSFVHSRDAWTSVVPTGLMLSAGIADEMRLGLL
jgi:uncharacterized membrane protein